MKRILLCIVSLKVNYGITVVLSLVIFLPASATVINIPADYATIQQGIDVSADGDTVLVQPGTYVENINFNGHNITLGSMFLTTEDTSYISTTVIDGDSTGRVVTFDSGENNTTTITGFTIRNGYGFSGSGIYCGNNSNPLISNNIIRDNLSGDRPVGRGGGIFCYYSSPIIRDNLITQNSIWGDPGLGGGINGFGSEAIVLRNIIVDNAAYGVGAGFAGGMFFEYSSPEISGNVIARNIANAGYGGGILFMWSEATMTNNTITSNTSHFGGGICSVEENTLVVSNSIIWGNNANEEIDYEYGTPPSISYSNIGGGWQGEGNIDCDPMFCGPEYDNYRLHTSSCCIGAGEDGADIGALGAGCGIPCDENYIVGDFNGSGEFNVADIIAAFSKLQTGSPDASLICECPPGSGHDWAVAMDVNNSCAFNVADVIAGFSRLQTGSPELAPCEACPPTGR